MSNIRESSLNVKISKSVLQNALNFFTFDDVHIETIP